MTEGKAEKTSDFADCSAQNDIFPSKKAKKAGFYEKV